MTWRNLPDERKTASTDAQWTKLIAEFPARWCAARRR